MAPHLEDHEDAKSRPDDHLRRVREMLTDTFEHATHPRLAASRASNVVRLMKYMLGRRAELWDTLDAVHATHDRVVREAMLAYARNPERLRDAANRSELVKEWFDLLAEAGAKVERERREAELYAAVAADLSEEDRSWREARAAVVARRWGSK